MKKYFAKSISLIAAVAITLTGCGHEHTFVDATCTEPVTCSGCEETFGNPLGHDFSDATCTESKVCRRCGISEGEPLGHNWIEATCTEPKTCGICGETDGEPLGHSCQVGICTTCNEEINKDIVIQLTREQEMIDELLDTVNVVSATKTSSATEKINLYVSIISHIVEHHQNSIDLCADYPELQDYKKSLESVVNSAPTDAEKYSSSNEFLSDFYNYLQYSAAAEIKLAFVKAIFK